MDVCWDSGMVPHRWRGRGRAASPEPRVPVPADTAGAATRHPHCRKLEGSHISRPDDHHAEPGAALDVEARVKCESEARMLGIQTDPLDTAGAVFMAILGLGCTWWGGLAVRQPRRPPKPFEGPVWVVRAWGLSYVLLGTCTTVRMGTKLVGKEPAWLMATYWVISPLLICSVTAAYLSRRRSRRRAVSATVGRHR